MNYQARRKKVTSLLTESGADALLFCQPENIRYLCGFSGTDGALLATEGALVFLTDSRYTTQANNEVCADRVVEYSLKVEGIVSQLKAFGIETIGFESSIAYGFATELQNKGDSSWGWLPLKDELHSLRLHKSEEEIQALSAAAELNALAFAEIEEMVRPNVSENEISLALEFAMRRAGAEEKAFDYIVASGTRGAMPHGVASDKKLAEGELVTIDFGGRLSGYHSDETITLALGRVSDELRSIYDIVLEAHDRALERVKPGVALGSLDKVARDYIRQCGYGDYFGHGLGHGVGLEIHEAPTLSPRSKLFAEEGMVFTIEPGVYVPGVGGVRIEDTVHVTADGYRVLTKIPKTFRNILLN